MTARHWHLRRHCREAISLLVVAVSLLFVFSGGRSIGSGSDQQSPSAGELGGVVTYHGPIPQPIPVPEAQSVRQILEVDRATKGLRDAVVYLEGVPFPEALASDRLEPAVMDQESYVFIPHVLAIRSGERVEFRNSDAANHGVTAASLVPANSFNVVTPPAGRYVHKFVSDKRPIAIGCPIHSGMAAWIWVFEHPYYAVTDAAGRFRIRSIPAGTYKLVVRHLDGKITVKRQVTIVADKCTQCSIDLKLNDAKDLDQPRQSP